MFNNQTEVEASVHAVRSGQTGAIVTDVRVNALLIPELKESSATALLLSAAIPARIKTVLSQRSHCQHKRCRSPPSPRRPF